MSASNAWSGKCIISSLLAFLLQSFKEYYLSKHTGRRLVWQHSLAHCILKANYGAVYHPIQADDAHVQMLEFMTNHLSSFEHFHFLIEQWKHELILSAFQASVLLLYNETDQLTMERIRRMTNLCMFLYHPYFVSSMCCPIFLVLDHFQPTRI
jgi:hypothetical protein